MWIILALVAVPIIEIALFIELGGLLGLWPTLALVVGTAVAGGVLLRAQGFAALASLQVEMERGGDPRGPLAHGVLILAAGLLMLTPGFFTDTVGFLLLIPPVRAAVIARAGRAMAARVVTMGHGTGFGARGPGAADMRRPESAGGGPIDAEYVDLDETDDGPPRPGGSGWSRPPEGR